MRVQFQVGACPLHDGHGSAATPDGSLDLHAAVVPTQNRVDEDAADRPEVIASRRLGADTRAKRTPWSTT